MEKFNFEKFFSRMFKVISILFGCWILIGIVWGAEIDRVMEVRTVTQHARENAYCMRAGYKKSAWIVTGHVRHQSGKSTYEVPISNFFCTDAKGELHPMLALK